MEEIESYFKFSQLQLELREIQRSLEGISVSADEIQGFNGIVGKPVLSEQRRSQAKGFEEKFKTRQISRSVSRIIC